jgi:methylmalonyl-CoA mutase cobalamin-binding domain/chain
VPGAKAGKNAFAEITDYRGAPVLAAARWIPGPGWGLALKIDRDEALEDFRQARYLTGAAAIFLILAEGSLLIGLWRQRQRAQLLRAQIRQERAIFNLKSYAEKIVASVPSGLLVLSGDLRILSANRSFLESFSLNNAAVAGRRLDEVAKADGLLVRIREVLQTGVAQHDVLFDLHFANRRESRPVRITITSIRIAEEEEARLLLTIQDLLEEERLHAARRASEQRFRDLVQGLDAIVWEADAASLRFTFVSHRAEGLLGFPPEHWLREPDFFALRIHKDDRERAIGQCRAAIATATDHEFEYRALAADGRVLWLRDIIHVLRDSGGRPRQLRGLTVDLTERKRSEVALRESEDQLRQAQKMDAVGQLAGGIAHDFNNLLMVIQGDSDLIRRKLPEEHPLRRNVDGIREASQQAAALTRQLLAFSRKQVLALKVVDLNGIVGGMQAMLERLVGETIQLVFVPKPDLGYVKADPSQLEQVIMNLTVNARDAMPDGGRLTMETDQLELDAPAAAGHGAATPGRYVVLAVSDTGCGMDEATKARLFEPFFTTKEPGRGTGLGLSTVYGIVRQSGGHIWVYSEPGHGTTFKICLPVVAEEPDRAGPVDGGGKTRGAETVLLVEDAPRVREVVREILEMNGYAVLEARHGQEAIDLSQRHSGPHPVDGHRRRHAPDERTRAGAAARAHAAGHARAVHVRLHRHRHRAPRRPGGRHRLHLEAIHARRPRCQGARGPGRAQTGAGACPMKPIRVLVAKVGLDGHDRGAKVVARVLRDAGMDVIYTGLHRSPEEVVAAAVQEDVDVLGISILSGAHMTLLPKVRELMVTAGAEDIILVGGGVIPDEDVDALKAIGVADVILQDTPPDVIVARLRELVAGRAPR